MFCIFYPEINAWLGKTRPMLTKKAAVKFHTTDAANQRAANIALIFKNNAKLKTWEIKKAK